MELYFALIFLLGVHWIGDFVFQSDWMALNKSKSWRALLAHVGVYSATLFVGSVLFFGGQKQLVLAQFVAVNGALHFLTDAITSRGSSYLWRQERRHDFFVLVGLDQYIHVLCIGLTLPFFMGG